MIDDDEVGLRAEIGRLENVIETHNLLKMFGDPYWEWVQRYKAERDTARAKVTWLTEEVSRGKLRLLARGQTEMSTIAWQRTRIAALETALRVEIGNAGHPLGVISGQSTACDCASCALLTAPTEEDE